MSFPQTLHRGRVVLQDPPACAKPVTGNANHQPFGMMRRSHTHELGEGSVPPRKQAIFRSSSARPEKLVGSFSQPTERDFSMCSCASVHLLCLFATVTCTSGVAAGEPTFDFENVHVELHSIIDLFQRNPKIYNFVIIILPNPTPFIHHPSNLLNI